jgi:NAD(P)-dependent dehydrogenase (short-subunit alcohol dehydrogenase family)
LPDPVILITGASRGIGAATARLAAARGFSVCGNYRSNRAAAEQVVADVRQAGRRAIAVQADVGVESDVTRLFETSGAELGG